MCFFLGGMWVKLQGCGCSVGGVISAYSLFLWSSSTRRLWKRMWAGSGGSTSFVEQSAVKCSWVDNLCIFTSHASVCMRGLPVLASTCWCSCVQLLNSFDSSAGDLWADSGGEATHWWPQSGQEGTCPLINSILPLYIRTRSSDAGWIYLKAHFFLCCMFPCLCHPVSVCFQVYYEPMLKLDIMTESELGQIFGTLDSLIPLHQGKPHCTLSLDLNRRSCVNTTSSFPNHV